MTDDESIRILRRYMPEVAIAPFLDYWKRHVLALRVSRSRNSKYGDYRLPTADQPQHAISVNGTLNRYHFLWVLLHEMAHLDTFERYGRRVRPHGPEWQQAYARVLDEYRHCFPAEMQPLVARYCAVLPLNQRVKQQIERQLTRYDAPGAGPDTVLDEQPVGTTFSLLQHPGQRFRSVEKRRTRWLCECLDDGRPYLIAGSARIQCLEPEVE